jgi:hypothetical protein
MPAAAAGSNFYPPPFALPPPPPPPPFALPPTRTQLAWLPRIRFAARPHPKRCRHSRSLITIDASLKPDSKQQCCYRPPQPDRSFCHPSALPTFDDKSSHFEDAVDAGSVWQEGCRALSASWRVPSRGAHLPAQSERRVLPGQQLGRLRRHAPRATVSPPLLPMCRARFAAAAPAPLLACRDCGPFGFCALTSFVHHASTSSRCTHSLHPRRFTHPPAPSLQVVAVLLRSPLVTGLHSC